MNRHMTHLIVVMALAMSFVFPVTDAHAIPIARLTLDSEPGDFIGQGGQFDILYDSVADTVSAQVRRRLGDGSPAELLWVLNSPAPGNQFALVFFGTDALGIPIQPGVYLDAQRADFAQPGHPGLDVSFQNRGSNTLTGSFTIFDVSFVTDPFDGLQIATFDAEFEQHSEGRDPALFGSFRFNLRGLLPEPSSFALLAMGLAALFCRMRRAR